MDYLEKSFRSIGKAIEILSRRFENLCIPIRHSFSYDLVAESRIDSIALNPKPVMFRIKVCRTECKAPSGSYVVNIRKSGGYHKDNKHKSPFDQSMCDVVFVDSPDGQYLIPSEKITQARAISLSQFKEYRLPS